MAQQKITRSISILLSAVVYTGLVMVLALQAASLSSNNNHVQRVSERLDHFKNVLVISPSEEPYWQAYRQSVLDNVTSNEALLRSENAQSTYSAPEYFAARLKRLDSLDRNMHHITEKFNALYMHLDSQQKRISDKYFEERRRHLGEQQR